MVAGLNLVACGYTETSTNTSIATSELTPTQGIFSYPVVVLDQIKVEARDIALSSRSITWILTNQSLIRLEKDRSTNVTLPEVFNNIHVAQDGSVWANSANHLARFDGTTWQVIPLPQEANGFAIVNMAIAPDGQTWVMLESKEFNPRRSLQIFSDRVWQTISFNSQRPDGYFFFSGLDGRGRPWVTWHGGAAYLEKDQWITVDENFGLLRFGTDGSRWAILWGAWTQILPHRGPSTSRGWVDTSIALCHQSLSMTEQCYLEGPLAKITSSDLQPLGIDRRSIPPPVSVALDSPVMGHRINVMTVAPDGTFWAITDALDKTDYGRMGFLDSESSSLTGMSQGDELICFSKGAWKTYPIEDMAQEIKSIQATIDGSLWILTNQSVIHIKVPEGDCNPSTN